MQSTTNHGRIYPWDWLKMWCQFAVPDRFRPVGTKGKTADATASANPNWQNQRFLQEQPLDLDRLKNPESTDSLLVVRPGDLERTDVCREVDTALQKKDRILLFKAFFADEEELLAWGREPARHFKNEAYLFDTPADPTSTESGYAMQSMDLHPAIEQMAAGSRKYLGFSVTLAEHNPIFRTHLERILAKIAERIPLDHEIRRCFTHSFLYHGNQYQALLHQATSPDFSFQIANSKYWRFVMHRWSPMMQAIPATGIPGVWLSKHQLIHTTEIPFEEVLAEPGDILFFPEHLWHEVHNVEDGPGLMCGLRTQYSTRQILKEALKRKHISRALAWHKYASLMSMTLTKPNLDRPEFQ